MANALTYQSEFTGQQMDERFTAVATLTAALEALTGVVAQKYVKPSDGIPSTDMTAAVQASLAKAESAVQSLADYYTKTEVDQLLAAINGMDYVDVSTLPTASASTMGKIYLLGPDSSGYYAYYYTSYDGTSYSWVGPLGTTEISLSNYATKAELNQLGQEVDAVNIKAEEGASLTEQSPTEIQRLQINSSNTAFATVSNAALRTHYISVAAGDVVRLIASDSGAQMMKYGFSTDTPAAGVAVTGGVRLEQESINVRLVSPVTGYFSYYCNNAYFADAKVYTGTQTALGERVGGLESSIESLQQEITQLAPKDYVSVSQNSQTGHTDINIGSNSYPVASVGDAKNFKATLTASDNIDTLKNEGSYLVNTTITGGTYPSDITTYAIISVFGTGNFVYQILAEVNHANKRRIWGRTYRSSSYNPWLELSWDNLDNGVLSASDNIDTLSKSGGYVIPINTTPQGTLPNGFVANNKISNLLVFANDNELYFQLFYKDGLCWVRNYNTAWQSLTQDFSKYFNFKDTLYHNEDIDNVTGQGSWLLNTTMVSGTFPDGVPTYAMLMQFGTGNYLVQILSQVTKYYDAKSWIRTKSNTSTFNAWIEVTNKPTPEPVDPSQPLYGKKIVFFGDSITEGSAAGTQGQINNYPQFVATRTGATIINVGIGGTQMANHLAAPDYNPFSFCNLVTAITTNVWTTQDEKASVIGKTTQLAALKALDLSTYDYCVIAYGQNDRSNGVQVGSSDSINNDEFYGALNNSINALLTAYPNLHIIYIAPYNRVSAPASNPLLPFVNAILDVADKWAMPAINLYKISGINAKTVGTYLEDGLHPKRDSKYGYEFLGNVIAAQITSIV